MCGRGRRGYRRRVLAAVILLSMFFFIDSPGPEIILISVNSIGFFVVPKDSSVLIDNNNSDIWSKMDELEFYLSQEMNITTLSDHHHHLYHHHEMKENGFSRMTQ